MGIIPTGAAVKIGLVIYGRLDTLTGGFFYDRQLVDHFRARGDSVEVFSLPMRSYARNLFDNLSVCFFGPLAEADIDVLLQDELNHPSLFLLNRRLKRRVSYPIVSIVHHLRCSEVWPDHQKALYRAVERGYLSTVDGFIFNSETTASTVTALVGDEVPSVVALPAADHLHAEIGQEEIRKRADQPGPLRIVFVGSLIRRKELHTLIDALAVLPLDSCVLDVIGRLDLDVEYVREMQDLIVETRLKHHVSICGPLAYDLLVDRLRRAHLLAVPSSYEGFGLVYLEGMGFGLPAIASTSGAAYETVTHGVNGFLVEAGDVQAIADAIKLLHKDRRKLVEMSLAARERFLQHPSWDETGRMVRAFLGDIIG